MEVCSKFSVSADWLLFGQTKTSPEALATEDVRELEDKMSSSAWMEYQFESMQVTLETIKRATSLVLSRATFPDDESIDDELYNIATVVTKEFVRKRKGPGGK